MNTPAEYRIAIRLLRAALAKSRDANACLHYGKAQLDAVDVANEALNATQGFESGLCSMEAETAPSPSADTDRLNYIIDRFTGEDFRSLPVDRAEARQHLDEHMAGNKPAQNGGYA